MGDFGKLLPAAGKRTITDERNRQAELMAKKRRAERSIVIPAVANPARREACRMDLVKFAETYFREPPDPEAYPGKAGLLSLPLSPVHREILQRFQERILYGGQQALAAPRGFGKDTLSVVAAIWGAAFGHTRFVVFVCWESSAAAARIAMVRNEVETNRKLAEDFPALCWPARLLERAAQRARMQTYQGQFTRIQWGELIVFASIPGVESSGVVIAPASISGNIRGMNVNGSRPSFVILSDPQTDESAKSPTQQEDVLRRINKDLGGLGGHSEPLATLALVTILRRRDVADLLTDPEQSPQWSGLRFRAIESWPARMDLWEEYEEHLAEDAKGRDATGRGAMRFYLENRGEMERGSRVLWEDAYIQKLTPDGSPLEVSALQHFMNLRWRNGVDAFNTEYQNEPPEVEGDGDELETAAIQGRLSGFPHRIVPREAVRVVRAIDVGARYIWHVTMAVAPALSTAWIVDYERVPVLSGELAAASAAGEMGDLRDPESATRPALEAQVLGVLQRLRAEEESGLYLGEDGGRRRCDLVLIDSGWLESVVYTAVKQAGPSYRATKGQGTLPGQKRFVRPVGRKNARKVSEHWWCGRLPVGVDLWNLDADHWKRFVQERLRQDADQPGGLLLFGATPKIHKWIARHLTAERWDPVTGKFVVVSRQNHWLDCAAMCLAGADMLGVRLMPTARELARGGSAAKVVQWGDGAAVPVTTPAGGSVGNTVVWAD
jgi:hypothetical protein